jgi:hypothetical protein
MKSNVTPFRRPDRANTAAIPAVARRVTQAAAQTRQAPAAIEQLPFDLSALEEDGLFVNVDASGFGMLNRRLDWQMLGITLPQGTDVAFHPPRCSVLPNRYRRPLLAPAAQAHAALRKYSYQFRLTETLFQTPEFRWVPWRAWPAFEAAFNVAAAHLDEAKAKVLADYEAIRQEVLATFTRLGHDSAQRLLATGLVVAPDFQERLARGVLDALPGEEELGGKLRLRYQVGVILLGSEMLQEQRRAAQERQRLEQVETLRHREQEARRAEQAVVQQRLWGEQESVRLRLVAERTELEREAEVKERLRQLKLEAAREKLHDALSPLQEGAAQLRSQVYESATAIHAALSRHEFLPGATAKKARNLAHWFRLMNFSSDAELERLVGALERLAARPPRGGKRTASNGEVREVLDDILELCYRDAQALAQPNRTNALEL